MADKPSPISFELPDARTVDAVAVELPGGRIVFRSPDELTPAPAKPIPPARPATKAE